MGKSNGTLLERRIYSMRQIDYVLGLPSGTSRRWIDGYSRGGKTYPPVIRLKSTGDDSASWGEFVETRLLSEYRDAGVPLVRMRPAIQALREELNTPYPLASARTWLDVEGKELIRKVQEKVGLETRLALVVVRTKQRIIWTKPADDFRRSVKWTGQNGDREPRWIAPFPDMRNIRIDPLRGFGDPVVRSVRTDVIAELFRSGESLDAIAEQYELPEADVDAAVRYELRRAAA